MRSYVGRRDIAACLLRWCHTNCLERDRGGHVIGVRRHVGDDRRHGMLAWVTALEPRGIVRRVRVRHRGVPVRRGAVVVVGVIVINVGVDVLRRCRPRGRQHGQGDHRCEHALHCGQSMGNATPGQISRRDRDATAAHESGVVSNRDGVWTTGPVTRYRSASLPAVPHTGESDHDARPISIRPSTPLVPVEAGVRRRGLWRGLRRIDGRVGAVGWRRGGSLRAGQTS